jgi:hypothetical protein
MPQLNTLLQQLDSLFALPAPIEARTHARSTSLPVDTRRLGTLERDIRFADVLPSLVVLARDELPEVRERSVFVHAELLDVAGALARPVQAPDAEVGLGGVDSR